MKSVVQIQRQGKVKDVSASTAAFGFPAEEIETKVALIPMVLTGLAVNLTYRFAKWVLIESD